MVDRAARLHAFERPDYLREPEPALPDRHFAPRLSPWRRLTSITAVRQVTILVLLAAAWQLYGAWLGNDLVLPSFAETARAFWHGIVDGPLLLRAWTSIRILLIGYAVAVVLATGLTLLAVASRVGTDLLTLTTAMFNPLPAIALLPV